jgi:multidrug transporter EmrE-like cation transporter
MTLVFTKFKQWTENSIVDDLILIAITIAIIESFAQNCIKNSNDDNVSFLFLMGLSIYIVVGYLLHFAYHKFPLSKVNVIWSSLSIILAISLGYIIYSEPMNIWKLMAVLFAMAAIYCSYMG